LGTAAYRNNFHQKHQWIRLSQSQIWGRPACGGVVYARRRDACATFQRSGKSPEMVSGSGEGEACPGGEGAEGEGEGEV
jgi:hypothetical protein